MFDLHPVTLSPKAAEEVRHIMQTKNIPADYGLRVGIRGAGCAGVSLLIGFDKKKGTDQSYTTEGITVLVDKRHTMYVIGKEIDFYEGAEGRGFHFVDTNQQVKGQAETQP
jgi:iron-sulfur cluster assembly protein